MPAKPKPETIDGTADQAVDLPPYCSAPLRESLVRKAWHEGLDWRRPVWMLSRISGVRENTIYQHCRRNGIKPVKSSVTIKGLLLLALEMALQDLSADKQADVPAVQSDEWQAWSDETLLALGYRKEPNDQVEARRK